MKSQIESLLLVASKPPSFKELAKILETNKGAVKKALEQLKEEYQTQKRGFRIISNDHNVELVTAPENAKVVTNLVNYERSAISQAKIETLTILAYQGPLTKVELEHIRGVNCSLILRNLKIEDLISETPEADAIKYQVSTKFLKMVGVSSTEELPDYDNLKVKS